MRSGITGFIIFTKRTIDEVLTKKPCSPFCTFTARNFFPAISRATDLCIKISYYSMIFKIFLWLSQVPLSHLSPLASITVTVCLHRVTYPLASGCNESRTGLPTSSSTLRHGHHLYRYSNNYTGYPLKQGLHINCVCLCTVLSIERHRFI